MKENINTQSALNRMPDTNTVKEFTSLNKKNVLSLLKPKVESKTEERFNEQMLLSAEAMWIKQESIDSRNELAFTITEGMLSWEFIKMWLMNESQRTEILDEHKLVA